MKVEFEGEGSPLMSIMVSKLDDGSIQVVVGSNLMDVRVYGVIVADVVKHVATALKVQEQDVWDAVDSRRYQPTSTCKEVLVN